MASRHGIVSAEASADLRAAMRALDTAPGRLRQLLDATAREQLSAAWTEELAASNPTKPQAAFITRSSSAVPISNGLIVGAGDHLLTKPYEFGANDRDTSTTYRRRNRVSGGDHEVTRRTRRQLPEHKAGGYIAYPSANRLGSRVFKMWGALINKVIHDSFEGKA